MFELEENTAAAREHTAKVGLVCAIVLLAIQAAVLLPGGIRPRVQDLSMFATIVMMGSDAGARLWFQNRRLAKGLRVLWWMSMIVAVAAVTVALIAP